MKKNTVNADESNIKIRKCLRKDLPEIFSILQSISNFIPDKKDNNKIWDAFIKQNNMSSIVIILDEKIIGYGSVVFETKIRGGIHGHIEDIAIHKDFHKNQFGTLLVNKLIQIAKEKKCYKVSLGCNENNLNFYKKNKFEDSGKFMQIIF